MKSKLVEKFQFNGAAIISKVLGELGVEIVFGIPGVHNLSLFEMLRRSGIGIVAPTHEQGAAFMANGYTRSTGKIGVFTTIPGPGLTNTITPISEAFVDSTPILGIVTKVSDSQHSYQIHELDQTSLLKPITKKIITVKKASEIPGALTSLWDQATKEEPGPVILQVPAHLYWEKGAYQFSKSSTRSMVRRDAQESIQTIVTKMVNAGQIGFYIGAGVANVSDEILELAEWLNAPIATTQTGRGIIDETHPLSLGFGWLNDSVESVNEILEKCDLIIAIGTKFAQTGTWDYRLSISRPLIHIDASAQVLGKNYSPELIFQMDSGLFIKSLLEKKKILRERKDTGILELIRVKREESIRKCTLDLSTQFILGDTLLSPFEFFQSIQELLPKNAIVVTDSGFNERLTVQNWIVGHKRTLLNPCDYEAMGFGIPASIGAAIANPDRPVVAIVGDGGLVISGLEILTVSRQNLNIKILVLNNHGFGIIKKIQKDFFGASIAVDHTPPNYEHLAKSAQLRFFSPDSGEKSLHNFLQSPGPGMMVVEMQHNEKNTVNHLKQRWKNNLKQGIQDFLN